MSSFESLKEAAKIFLQARKSLGLSTFSEYSNTNAMRARVEKKNTDGCSILVYKREMNKGIHYTTCVEMESKELHSPFDKILIKDMINELSKYVKRLGYLRVNMDRKGGYAFELTDRFGKPISDRKGKYTYDIPHICDGCVGTHPSLPDVEKMFKEKEAPIKDRSDIKDEKEFWLQHQRILYNVNYIWICDKCLDTFEEQYRVPIARYDGWTLYIRNMRFKQRATRIIEDLD